MFKPAGLTMPTFVVETGWSESRTHLLDDMNLWLVSGNGAVRAVHPHLAKSREYNGRPRRCGVLYLDRTGTIPILIEQHVTFPISERPPSNKRKRSLGEHPLDGKALFWPIFEEDCVCA
jgi:hypothetical protein